MLRPIALVLVLLTTACASRQDVRRIAVPSSLPAGTAVSWLLTTTGSGLSVFEVTVSNTAGAFLPDDETRAAGFLSALSDLWRVSVTRTLTNGGDTNLPPEPCIAEGRPILPKNIDVTALVWEESSGAGVTCRSDFTFTARVLDRTLGQVYGRISADIHGGPYLSRKFQRELRRMLGDRVSGQLSEAIGR